MEDESSGGWRLAAGGWRLAAGGQSGEREGWIEGCVWRGSDRGWWSNATAAAATTTRDGGTGRPEDGGIVVPLVGSGGTSPTSSAGRWGNGTGANGRASPLYVVSASFPIGSLAGGRSPLSLPGRRDGCAPEEGNIMTAVLAYRRRKATRAGLHVPTPRCR